MAISRGPKIVTNGLVLTLDAADKNSYKGSGTSWLDLSGNNNTGTLTNGSTFNNIKGGSIFFDGTNDYVNFAVNSVLNITNNLTLDAWFNATTFAPIGSIFTYGTSGGEQYSLWTYSSPNQLIFSTNWPNTWYQGATTGTFTTNTWYNIIVTFSSGTWTIYINGAYNNSGTFAISTFPAVASAYLTLGVNHPGGQEYFNGNISTARIYNRVLTSSQVLQNYNATRSRFGL
jgi:hypothetical protein